MSVPLRFHPAHSAYPLGAALPYTAPVRTSTALWVACAALALCSRAEAQTCEVASQVPLERHLRQLYLDLLNRPPTIAEYEAARARGAVTAEDIRELMSRDDFYGRMREYHRALFRSNISASVYNNGDSRLLETGDAGRPLQLRGNPARPLRGRQGQGCDPFILQSACNTAPRQDPHAEPATKTCYDSYGIPMAVSYDYDTSYFACSPLAGAGFDGGTPAISCPDAVTKGLIPDKHLYFCDMRRDTPFGAALRPWLCMPDPARYPMQSFTNEVTDPADLDRVVSFTYAGSDAAMPSYTKLDRCRLTPDRVNGVAGSYSAQRGCIQREGYEWRPTPFWDATPRPQVAICAIEAQDRAVNPATGESCEAQRFLNDRSCGCGVRMRRCESGDRSVHDNRVAAFSLEPELIADSVLRRDEPYFNILTTRRGFMNGVAAELHRERQGVFMWAVSVPVEPDAVPNLTYADRDIWREVIRRENHSGILTTPAFLYRFPTQRARVNQFYEALLCKTFTPPADASLPAPDDSCNRENNLAKRCGCNYCHATIEPTGAHWGRYGERAATFLDPLFFPRFDTVCRDCALSGNIGCGGDCANYVMQAYDGDGAQSLGMLKTYLYRTDSEEPNIEGGPKLLVERALQTGDLERCLVKRVWNEFLGRPMTEAEQRMYLDSLTRAFTGGGGKLKALIEKVVTSDAYRRLD